MVLVFVLIFIVAMAAITYAAFVEQEDLPPELAKWLRPKEPATQLSSTPAAQPQQSHAQALAFESGSATRWRLMHDGRAHELHKDFEDGIQADGRTYAAPAFVLTCMDGRWYARLEPRLRLQGAHEGGNAAFEVGGKRFTAVGTATTAALVRAPDGLVELFRAGKPLTVRLHYRDIGAHELVFNPAGFKRALTLLPAQCR